jgi:hypothetical protein
MDYERKPIQAPTVSGFRFHTPYRSNSLMDHYAQFIFHHHDLCLFHQALYNEIAHRQEALSDFRRPMWEAKRRRTYQARDTKFAYLQNSDDLQRGNT